MNAYTLFFLAFVMSLDAFAATTVKGATTQRLRWIEVAKIALLFGVVEGLTPFIGWLGGSFARQFIADWDHWAAFILLSLIGGRMVYEGIASRHNAAAAALQSQCDDNQPRGNAPVKTSLWLTLTTAIGTSIDSMIMGVSLAFMEVNILLACIAIGMATTIMSVAGLLLGRVLGRAVGQYAEIIGGLVLIGIGLSILLEHTGLLP